MSRAFINEDLLTGDILDRPISAHPNYVTATGLNEIELALKAARHNHGLAQVGSDRAELAKTSSELRYWSARRESARLLAPDPSRKCVQFGSTVAIVRDGRRQRFQIVGEDEADPSKGKISYVSPLARAIVNKEVGETAEVGDSEVEILAISLD